MANPNCTVFIRQALTVMQSFPAMKSSPPHWTSLLPCGLTGFVGGLAGTCGRVVSSVSFFGGWGVGLAAAAGGADPDEAGVLGGLSHSGCQNHNNTRINFHDIFLFLWKINIRLYYYPWSGLISWLWDLVSLHSFVKNACQGINAAANSFEIIHINGPGHGTQVSSLPDKVHLDLHALLVFVSNPLSV